MEIYDIEDRRDIYAEALRRYKESRIYFGLCLALSNAVDRLGYPFWDAPIDIKYPELYAFKPIEVDDGAFWWPVEDCTSRIKVLEECIANCDKQICVENFIH